MAILGELPMENTQKKVADYFAGRPSAMTLMAAKELGLPEAEVLRALGAVELKADAFEAVMEALKGWGKVHVIVSNRGATMEARGEFGNFSRSGPFFNIEYKGLDLHLRPAAIGAIFLFEKPAHTDGKPTRMLQFYDAQGDAVMKAVCPADREDAFKALMVYSAP